MNRWGGDTFDPEDTTRKIANRGLPVLRLPAGTSPPQQGNADHHTARVSRKADHG